MERLTMWEYGDRTLNCNNCPMQGDCDDSRDCVEVLLERLTAYEDTGLTAEEIVFLKAENATLKKKLDAAMEDLKSVAQQCKEYHIRLSAVCKSCADTGAVCCDPVLRGCVYTWRGEDSAK